MARKDINRRDAVKLLALVAAASGTSMSCGVPTDEEALRRAARETATQPGADYQPRFFTEHELKTATLLADMIIPADERSGSASDAGVPEFIDFIMSDEMLGPVERRQTAMRGGLAWLDYQCLRRFENKPFIECALHEREELLDLIAYPGSAPPDVATGVRFFNSFRDLTLTGFFTSKMGVEDLGYVGNTTLAEFPSCPPEVLEHIGLDSTRGA